MVLQQQARRVGLVAVRAQVTKVVGVARARQVAPPPDRALANQRSVDRVELGRTLDGNAHIGALVATHGGTSVARQN